MMARYDRIARLEPPPRENAFPGWHTLRDLEGREREPELGRRARLRFLAIRPVLRLLARGLEAMDTASFQRQLDSVREELGHLPARDPERACIADYLKAVGGRTPEGIAGATLDVGRAAEASGHPFAAEEFYQAGLRIAEEYGLDDARLQALRRIATIQRRRGDADSALATLGRAAALAERVGDLVEWARALDGVAAVALRLGDVERAREALDRIDERGRSARHERVRAVAAAGRCALEIAVGSPEAAVEAGWQAIDRLGPDDEDRNGVLLNMGAGFRRLRLFPAAVSCYRIIERWSAWPEHRIEAQVESAAVAAEMGDTEAFRRNEAAVVASLDRADPGTAGLAALGLGRAAMVMGETGPARDHLRHAIAVARDADDASVLTRAEELLSALERDVEAETMVAPATPSDGSRNIARRVEELSRELVPTI